MDITPFKTGKMIRASIDIGTNSVLLLVAEIKQGKIHSIIEKQQIPRLGKGVDRDKSLSSESRKRVISVLRDYKEFLESNYPDIVSDTVVTATSAVRDALNRRQFLREIEDSTGWKVLLLSGDEEAQVTFKGALSTLKSERNKQYAVLDIGGGSTEITLGKPDKLHSFRSVDMGSVRFSERFILEDPPESAQISKAKEEIKKLLNTQNVPDDEFVPVGVAGTVTSLAAIALGLKSYNPEKLNGYILKKDRIGEFIAEFSSCRSDVIEKTYPFFLKGRGDVILAGVLILYEFLTWCQKDEITVSTGGIRHGTLLSE